MDSWKSDGDIFPGIIGNSGKLSEFGILIPAILFYAVSMIAPRWTDFRFLYEN